MSNENNKKLSNENNKKERKPIVEYLLSSGGLYLFTVVFAILGVVFISQNIDAIWKILMGILFFVPTAMICFHNGKTAGEKEYKKLNKNMLSDIHTRRYTEVKLYKAVFHVAFYLGSALILIISAEIFQFHPLQGIMLILFIAMTLLFMGLGVLDISKVTWLAVLPIAIHVIVTSGLFILGYVVGVNTLRRRSADIVNEIRSIG